MPNAPALLSYCARSLPEAGVLLSADAGEGSWITLRGVHIFVGKDGTIEKGPSHFLGKKPEELAPGDHPAPRPGFTHAARDAKGGYHHPDPETDARLKAMHLAPGYKGAQLNLDPKAKLQAVAVDKKGRDQYKYSTEHSGAAAAEKFARVRKLQEALPGIREKIAGHPSEEAAVLRLVSKTGLRIGSEADTGAEKQAYGATTLKAEHVVNEGGKTKLAFVGKKGVSITHEVHDPELAKELNERAAKANSDPKSGGRLYNTSDAKVRDHLHGIAGDFKVKDLRTAVAAHEAGAAMKGVRAPTDAKSFVKAQQAVAEHVSSRLGNTPAVALKAYIPPEVFSKWRSGVANAEQADLIQKYAAQKGLEPNAAAKEWITQHAADYRKDFNDRFSGKSKPKAVAPDRFGVERTGRNQQLRPRAGGDAGDAGGAARRGRGRLAEAAAQPTLFSRAGRLAGEILLHSAEGGESGGMTKGAYGDLDHYVTLESGRVIFLTDSSGTVPPRLRAEAGASKKFSKVGLRRAILDHHRMVNGGEDDFTSGMEHELTEAGGDVADSFKFHKKLPTEIKDAIADHPALRRVFTVTDNVKEAHGADAFSALGDRYIDTAQARAGSPLNAALETARGSQDPEMRLLAHVHDNLPEDAASLKAKATKLRASAPKNLERAAKLAEQAKTATAADAAKLNRQATRLRRDATDAPQRAAEHEAAAANATKREAVNAAGLRVGDQFHVNGERYRVAEHTDEGGNRYRVLHGADLKENVPVDAVSHLPVDRGTFKPGRLPRGRAAAHMPDDGIPFSRVTEAPILLSRAGAEILLSSGGDSSPPDYWREVEGQPIPFWGTPGHGVTESQMVANYIGRAQQVKIHGKGGTKTITVEPDKGGHRVTESGPGKGQHTDSWHPNADSAARDANSRVSHAETAAKAAGTHVATVERVPGKMPEGEGRYIVKPGGFEKSGPTGSHVIDRMTGEKSFVPGDRAAADAHVAKLEARNAKAAPKPVESDPIAANRAAAEARVAARKAAPAVQSKAGKDAAAAAKPTVLTGYHGSPNKFDEFRVTPGASENKWGPGVYFDPTREGATDFVRNGAKEGTPHHLYTAKVTLNKPYEADGPIRDEHFDAINKAAAEMGKQGVPEEFRGNGARGVYKMLTTRNNYDNGTANQILQHAGFDGVKDTNEFVAFDPKAAKIQSVRSFGNPAAVAPAGHTVEETPAGHVVKNPEGKVVDGPTSRHKAERIADELDDMRSGAIQQQTTPASSPATQSHAARQAMSAPVDTSRQLGIFAKDAAGNHAEVGERAGQANLPGLSIPKGATAPKAAPAPRDEPGQMTMNAPAVRSKAGAEATSAPPPTGATDPYGGMYDKQAAMTKEAWAKGQKTGGENVRIIGKAAAHRLAEKHGFIGHDLDRGAMSSDAIVADHTITPLKDGSGRYMVTYTGAAKTLPPASSKAGSDAMGAVPGGVGGISRDVAGNAAAYDAVPSVATRTAAFKSRLEAGPVTVHTTAGSHEYGTERLPSGDYRDYSRHPGGNKITGKPVDTEAGARAVAATRAAHAEADAIRQDAHVRTSGSRSRANLSRAPELLSHAGREVLLSAGPHKFSSTQFNLPPDVAEKVKTMAARIPDEHLVKDGREEVPHVTSLYGIHGDDPAAVRNALAGEGPVKFRLGKTSIFPASEGRDFDVVKLDVLSTRTLDPAKKGDLHRVNRSLSDALPHTSTFPTYSPHCTLAYVRKGMGQKYAGMDDLHGRDVTCDHLTFSDRDDNQTHIPLTGPTEKEPKTALLRKALERRGELMRPALSSHAARSLVTA